MAIVVGLYSPSSQSGKSTACAALARTFTVENIKISGAMKAMNASLLKGLVPDNEADSWIDGKLKDTIVPGLIPDRCCNHMPVNAFIHAIGERGSISTPLKLTDATGTPLTWYRLMDDMKTTWRPALERIFAATGGLTCRDIQKTIGLEWFRMLYGADIWIRIVQGRVDASTAQLVVVDDVRFPDDADLVVNRAGFLVRIWRPKEDASDGHASEGLLEDRTFDARLDNDSDLETYLQRVEAMLVEPLRDRIS